MVKKVGKGKQREVKRSREGAGSLYIRMEAAATIGTRNSRTTEKRREEAAAANDNKRVNDAEF